MKRATPGGSTPLGTALKKQMFAQPARTSNIIGNAASSRAAVTPKAGQSKLTMAQQRMQAQANTSRIGGVASGTKQLAPIPTAARRTATPTTPSRIGQVKPTATTAAQARHVPKAKATTTTNSILNRPVPGRPTPGGARAPAAAVRPPVARGTLGTAAPRPGTLAAPRPVPGRPVPGQPARPSTPKAGAAGRALTAPGIPTRSLTAGGAPARTFTPASTVATARKQQNYIVKELPEPPAQRRMPLVLTDEKAIIGEPHSDNRWTCKKCNRLNRNLRKICGRQNCSGIAPLNLKQVVVDCANVGCRYGETHMLTPPRGQMFDKERHRKFHWQGVREALKHYHALGLIVSLVSKENWPAPIPPDLEKHACTVPRMDGDKENDDYFVLKIAFQQNCFYVTNDNFRNWKEEVEDPVMAKWFLGTKRLLHVSYVFSNTGAFVPRRDAVLGFTTEEGDDESEVGSPRIAEPSPPRETSPTPTPVPTQGVKAPATPKSQGLTRVAAPPVSKASGMMPRMAKVPGHTLRAAVPKSRSALTKAIPKSPQPAYTLSSPPRNTDEEHELMLQSPGPESDAELCPELEIEGMDGDSGFEGSTEVIDLVDQEELVDEELEMDGEEMEMNLEEVEIEAEFEEEEIDFDGEEDAAAEEDDLDELELDGAEDTEDSIELDMDEDDDISLQASAQTPTTDPGDVDTPDTPATPMTAVSDGALTGDEGDDELELDDDQVEVEIDGDGMDVDGGEEGEVELEVDEAVE